jgi:Zn-dependent M28 family amino/carboxypeptidase
MGSNCFVLWGAEEIGLVGSRFYLNSLSAEQKSKLRAVLNFDMVGFGEQAWWLIGTPDLQRRAQAVATDSAYRRSHHSSSAPAATTPPSCRRAYLR